MECLASLTLKKARFFVDQASRTDPNDTETIANYLEAAIVFARSVTFHLQSQFTHVPGFKEWYAEQQKRLRSDPLSRFMLDKRNYVLKVGSVSVKRIIGVAIEETVVASAEMTIRIIRGKPWYRRSPRFFWRTPCIPFGKEFTDGASGGLE